MKLLKFVIHSQQSYKSVLNIAMQMATTIFIVNAIGFSAFAAPVLPPVLHRVACVTNTRSTLSIDLGIKEAVVDSTAGDHVVIQITNVIYEPIDTKPQIDSYTFDLNDGRKILVQFTSLKNYGTGNWVRLDGTYSPNFRCTR